MLLFTKAALYPLLFREPECWFSWGLNRQPLPQHTNANPIELIGQLEVMSLSILPISLVAVGSPFITHLNILAPVVQTLDSAIHQIKNYPADNYNGNQLRYPLDSDLSGG